VFFLDDGRIGCYNNDDIVRKKTVNEIVDVKWDKDMYKACVVSSINNSANIAIALSYDMQVLMKRVKEEKRLQKRKSDCRYTRETASSRPTKTEPGKENLCPQPRTKVKIPRKRSKNLKRMIKERVKKTSLKRQV